MSHRKHNPSRRDVLLGAGAAVGGVVAARGHVQAAQAESPPAPAESPFRVKLPPHRFARDLLVDSPFGINTQIFRLDDPDIEQRLRLMQEAGIKWGRQDFTWRRIEQVKGRYDLDRYEEVADLYHKYGLHLFGNFAYSPKFHDPRTPEGVEAYCALARATVKRFRGKVDYWQLWNEPNGGFWDGTPEEYARLAAAAGKVIHETNPQAKVLGFNMAFCDVLWAETILKLIPYDSFDIVCYHPYRPPSPPEEIFDWWVLDRYQKVALSKWHKGRVPPDYPLIRMSFLQQTEELVKVMEKFGKVKPFWITEMNWNTPISPYGTPELKQADVLVRFYMLGIGSRRVAKIFPWGFSDRGPLQYSMGHMVGLVRHDLSPRYSYYAHAWMARLLEGKRWVRNDEWGPNVYAVVFTDDRAGEDTIVAWSTRAYGYLRVNNEKGLTLYDLYGTKREVPFLGKPGSPPPVTLSRWTASPLGTVTVPLSRSPIYIVGPAGLQAAVRPNPGE